MSSTLPASTGGASSTPQGSLAVVFVTSSQPQPRLGDGAPPLGLDVCGATGATCMELWWAQLDACQISAAESVYLATNAQFYKYFEYEAFGRGVPLPRIVNSGRSLGDNRVDWSTLTLVLRLIGAGREVLLVSSDSAPPQGFSLASVLAQARASGSSALLAQPPCALGSAGPVCLAELSGSSVTRLHPSTATPSATPSASAQPTPLLFFLAAADVATLLSAEGEAAVRACAPPTASTLGEAVVPVEAAMCHLASLGRVTALPCPTPFQAGAMSGQPHTLPSSAAAATTPTPGPYSHHLPRTLLLHPPTATPHYARGYARVGLLGNPSDGYGGATLAVTIDNFYAEAWVTPTPPGAGPAIHLLPHPTSDPQRFPSLQGLSTLCQREGYSGGLRLMAATLHRLQLRCSERGYALDRARGFTARYHTTVPRQVGLAGSSAIITAFLKACMGFYGLGGEEAQQALGLTRDLLPGFVLAIEQDELGITAGLQDRVVQSYQTAVHMNFDPALVKAQGHGAYTPIPVASLPPLFLAYAADPSDSGRIHAPIKQRWLAGDAGVIAAMAAIAALADEGLALARRSPYSAAAAGAGQEAVAAAWAALFTRNFDGRRGLFGDAALGRDNIRMVEIARGCGASAKFPGSGGAVVGVVDVAGMRAAGGLGEGEAGEGEAALQAATAALRAAYHREGYVFVRLAPTEGGK